MGDLPDNTPIIEEQPEKPKRKRGKPHKSSMIGTIHEAFAPYVDSYPGFKPYEIAIGAAEHIVDKYPQLEKVLEGWRALNKQDKRRHKALDTVVRQHMDFEEFKQLCRAAIHNDMQTKKDSSIHTSIPDLVKVSLTAARIPENSKERMKWLERAGDLLPPPGQVTNIKVTQQTLQQNQRGELPSFENQMDTIAMIARGEQKQLPPAIDVTPEE